MKNIKTIIVSILLTIHIISCDSFLDIKPTGKVIPETLQDFREVLTAAYSTMPKDRALSTVRSDELQLNASSGSNGHLEYKNIFIWDDFNKKGTKPFPWQNFYKVLLNANQVIINGTKPTEGKKVEINQLHGEAYLLRAYTHFNLVNLYADIYSQANLSKKAIPLATTINIWKNFKKNTIAEVYQQIENDLLKGLSLINIEEQEKGYNYRFSKVSGYGFAARFYLFKKDWVKAKEYAQKAYDINHKLEDLNKADATIPQNYKSVENILALEQIFTSDLKYYFTISDKLLQAFDQTEDLRFSKYFEKKKDRFVFLLGRTNEFLVSMRTAEFYLILAEAEAKMEGGNLAKAKEQILNLTKTRFTPALFAKEETKIKEMNKEAIIQRIEKERFREFACQGFRWYDLRRNGKPALTKDYEAKSHTLAKDDPRYVVPFPEEAITSNPNLLEN